MSHNPDSRALSLLRAILEDLKSSARVSNAGTINTMRELLSQKDYIKIATHINGASDAEYLLDFILPLLRNESHANGVLLIKESRRARRLLLKIASKTPVIPRSLYIKGVTVKANPDYISCGGFGLVVKGELGGELVALKVLYKNAHHNSSDFCREALTWRSLDHRFVLPLLGIYEEQDPHQLFLVSPYMKNGTLAQWRKTANPSTNEIEQRMLEVAQGIEYIHSEGVVHGDLRGDNILLDSNFHVQIADFGLTRHLEATVTKSGAMHHNFAAPELFGDWDAEDDTEDDGQSMARTQKSDIYAFGCLYYEIHYDAVPFARLKEMQIVKLVCRGERPLRLDVPSLSDQAWRLMQDCWAKEKTTRPAIENVVERMMIWETLQRSAPTQHSCRKDELALSNGLSDVTLPTVTASKPPISPSMMFDPGWTVNDLFRQYRVLFFYLFFPGFMWLFITSLDRMRSTVAQPMVEQRTATIEQPTSVEQLAAVVITSTTETAVTLFQTPWTVVTMTQPTEPVTMTFISRGL